MYIYILRCEDNSLYTGITTNFERRLRQHMGKIKGGAKYTASHKVVNVEMIWSTTDETTARKLEYHIKKLSKSAKEKLILSPHSITEIIPVTDADIKPCCNLMKNYIDKTVQCGVSLYECEKNKRLMVNL